LETDLFIRFAIFKFLGGINCTTKSRAILNINNYITGENNKFLTDFENVEKVFDIYHKYLLLSILHFKYDLDIFAELFL